MVINPVFWPPIEGKHEKTRGSLFCA